MQHIKWEYHCLHFLINFYPSDVDAEILAAFHPVTRDALLLHGSLYRGLLRAILRPVISLPELMGTIHNQISGPC